MKSKPFIFFFACAVLFLISFVIATHSNNNHVLIEIPSQKINVKTLIGGRGTISISSDNFYHPQGGSEVSTDTDESQLLRLPYSGKLHNISLIMSSAQSSGDVCRGYIRYTETFQTSTNNTILFCSIQTGSLTNCLNETASVSVTNGSYIKFYFDEVSGTCSGVLSWNFIYEIYG